MVSPRAVTAGGVKLPGTFTTMSALHPPGVPAENKEEPGVPTGTLCMGPAVPVTPCQVMEAGILVTKPTVVRGLVHVIGVILGKTANFKVSTALISMDCWLTQFLPEIISVTSRKYRPACVTTRLSLVPTTCPLLFFHTFLPVWLPAHIGTAPLKQFSEPPPKMTADGLTMEKSKVVSHSLSVALEQITVYVPGFSNICPQMLMDSPSQTTKLPMDLMVGVRTFKRREMVLSHPNGVR